jgi:uncharacterized protein involved in exopolysaccharide biosynthesis
MKKWMYLIFPGVMLGLFLIFYVSHMKTSEQNEAARKEVAAKKTAEEKRMKEESEQRAREDAAKKQAEREAEEKKKEDDRRAKQAAIDKEIADGIAAAKADADKAHKQLTDLEVQLDALKKEKDRLGRETFEAAKAVEAARVARRNAELESQRMLEMIVKRAADSSLTRMPQPPAPAAPAGR